MIDKIQEILEKLEGQRNFESIGRSKVVLLSLWWTLLLIMIFCAIGRTTKFVYIDF